MLTLQENISGTELQADLERYTKKAFVHKHPQFGPLLFNNTVSMLLCLVILMLKNGCRSATDPNKALNQIRKPGPWMLVLFFSDGGIVQYRIYFSHERWNKGSEEVYSFPNI